MTEFREMGLRPELIESLTKIGFTKATEVQERAIPEILQGKDVIARAKTGTGKTGAFIVPIAQNMRDTHQVEALVIVPTRELAVQVADFAEKVCRPLGLYTTTVYGGASINNQIREIRSGVNIVVGTPGRLLDLIERGVLRLNTIKYAILDEADIMFDMGFIEDVERILTEMPSEKQLMLFSATMPREIAKIAERYSKHDRVKITVGPEEDLTVKSIKQLYTIVPRNLKFSALLAYIKEYSPKKAIIFAKTKSEANLIHKVLVAQEMHAILLHGGLTQAMRERSLKSFRGGAQFLIATNVAARGLDIADVSDIINFGCPDDPTVFVHRVGRSARMGKEGRAVTIVEHEQQKLLQDVQDYANVKMEKINLDLKPFQNIVIPRRENSFGRGGGDRFGRGGGRFERGGDRFGRRRGFHQDSNRGHDSNRGQQRHGGGHRRVFHR